MATAMPSSRIHVRVGARIDQALGRGHAEVEVRGDQRALQDVEVFLHLRALRVS